MARLARFIVPGLPHHVTQRGNGRRRTFFCDADDRLYFDLLRAHCRKAEVAVWSWVLMPNHVHLILVPEHEDGLTDTGPVLDRTQDFAALLRAGEDASLSRALRRAESIGRPLGGEAFLTRIERTLGRDPRPRKRGRPGKRGQNSALSP